MLQAAIAEKQKGCDIIIGYVETHDRKETAMLTEGFELIPRKNQEYKSIMVQEMDLDAIIARKTSHSIGRRARSYQRPRQSTYQTIHGCA